MVDVASLVIKADTSQVKTAANDLNKLSSASKNAQSSSQSLTSSFVAMRGALAAVGISASLGQIVRTMDSYTKLTSQLKLATQNQLEFNEAYKNVQRIAEVSQSSLEETGVLYARLSTALRDMGASQSQVSDVTEAVSLGLKISGASAAESASAMLQLSQAFSSGVLRGEEFNAVNEAAPRLMTALAESLNVTRGELRQMAMDGKLTSDVVGNALLKSIEQFRKEAKLTQNISGGLTGISNEFTLMVGEIDKATGASKALAWAFKEIANAIKEMRTSDGGWLSWAIKATPLRGLESIIPKSNAEGREQSGMIRKAGETGTLQAPKRIAETPAPISSANLKALTDARKKATDEANKEEIRRLNVAIWVNEQIALSEQKKNDEIAELTEKRMDIEQQRANENFAEAQRLAAETTKEYDKNFEDLKNAIDGYAKDMADSFVEFAITGKTSFSDMINAMLRDLLRLSTQKLLFEPFTQAFSGGEGGGLLGGFMSSLAGAFSGSGVSASAGAYSIDANPYLNFGGFRAMGGSVSSGSSYIVGERGPELFTPSSSGSITPNNALGSNVSVVINNNSQAQATAVETKDARGNRRIEVTIGDMVASEIKRNGSTANQAIGSTFATRPRLVGR